MRLDPFADILARAIGLDAASLGERGLRRAVDAAMSRAGAANPEDYARLLAASPEALNDLVRETVVPETWFFRDAEPFRCLGERLRTLKRRGTPPRILSAPCATGEEAYSIAITCLEAGFSPGGFQLTAVDISAEALAVAARGRYGRNSFRDDLGDASRHFIRREGDGMAAVMDVRPEVAATVTFVRGNIVGPGFLAKEKPFDIIFSRNLLIYLNKEARGRLVANLGRLLAPDGLLFVGHSEVQSFLSAGYRPVPHARAFACRRETPEASPAGVLPVPPAAAPLRAPSTPSPAASGTPVRSPAAVPVHDPAGDVRPAPAARTTGTPGGDDSLDRARRLADRGDLAQAAALCRRHLEADGRCAEAYYLLGLVGAAEHRVEEAKALFQKALYLDPGHAASLEHLALIHDALGDAARASLCRQRLGRLAEAGGGGHARG
jgi:chemotaxis protein methyltransferase WspC